MPLVTAACIAYAVGLLTGFGGVCVVALFGGALGSALAWGRRDARLAALALLTASGAGIAELARRSDARCGAELAGRSRWRVLLIDRARPGTMARGTLHDGRCSLAVSAVVESGRGEAGQLVVVHGTGASTGRGLFLRDAVVAPAGGPEARSPMASLRAVRASAGVAIDRVFGGDAPVARALLVADMRGIAPERREQYADAGLVHMLSISGLHVAIIAGAMQLLLQLLRLGPRAALLGAVAGTALYIAILGAPPPAVRSGTMLAVSAASRLVQRPTSVWASLALGALVPLWDPRTILDLGYQLSVAGMAGLIASGALARRLFPRELRGWRRMMSRELLASLVATLATAPLVAWSFGRVSVVAPLTNLVAGPLLAIAQPMLFLALALAPLAPLARFVADAAHPLLWLFDAIAAAGSRVPYAVLPVAPTLASAVACGGASIALIVACGAYHPGRALLAAGAALSLALWLPLLPARGGRMELHLLDVGQGDAVAIRTTRGRWILVDAGRGWRGGDAGRRTIVPYLRRRGGEVEAFILSHPHADHAGGATTVVRSLAPRVYFDAAFAGGADVYAASLTAARERGVAWRRVHPGDSLVLDGTVLRFLAPDSAWTASLADPNEASTVLLVRHGAVRFLLVGDAEGAEERWLLEHAGGALRADVLKVGHHGSGTSTSAAFLAAVAPRVALVSVGAANRYGHPSAAVLRSLAGARAQVLRTDRLGTIVVRTDGRRLTLSAQGETWDSPPPPPPSALP